MNPIPAADGSHFFVEAGLVALRDEKTGGFRDPVSVFLAVPAEEINSTGTQTRSEDAACDEIGRILAEKFGAYLRGIREIERLQKRKEKNHECKH